MHVEVIIFDSVRFLLKKITKSNYLKKKNKTKPKPGQTDRFGFFRAKTGSNRARFSRFWFGFFRFWLGFFGLARFFWFGSVFPVWLGFFLVFLFQFGFFSFLLIKPNQTGRFFQNFNQFNRFFFVRFFLLFFFVFQFNRFFDFFPIPTCLGHCHAAR